MLSEGAGRGCRCGYRFHWLRLSAPQSKHASPAQASKMTWLKVLHRCTGQHQGRKALSSSKYLPPFQEEDKRHCLTPCCQHAAVAGSQDRPAVCVYHSPRDRLQFLHKLGVLFLTGWAVFTVETDLWLTEVLQAKNSTLLQRETVW